MKRSFDLILAFLTTLAFFMPACLVALIVRLTSKGPVIYWSNRVGRYNKIFKMPKFRTMSVDTPAIPTHLMVGTKNVFTPVGSFLRKSSLDEIPQLWSIILGDMSFVGPRPALFNQEDLIKLRNENGVQKLIPGLTGWAQVNGRDELSVAVKVALDAEYLERQSFLFDLYVLLITFLKVVRCKGISH